MNMWINGSCLFSVPFSGIDVNQRRDLPAHQLRLLRSLVLHRLGNPGDAHPPLPLPSPPTAFQGGCLTVTLPWHWAVKSFHLHHTVCCCLTVPAVLTGPPGHRRHLHSGLFLHRGSVSVLGPLEHGEELRPHADRSPCLLRHRPSLPSAPQVETSLQ